MTTVRTGATTAALVVHYGCGLGTPLQQLALEVQDVVTAALGSAFVPRDPATVHSTVLGLDDTPPELHAPLGALVVAGLVERPLRLQAGGWPDVDLAVSSRGRRLRERTLSRFGHQLVLLAWPVEPIGVPNLRLDTLRRDLVAAGGRHRYPLDATSLDPDAHLVVGTIEQDIDLGQVDADLESARDRLAQTSLVLDVGPDDLCVVTYDDPALPPATTRVSHPWR